MKRGIVSDKQMPGGSGLRGARRAPRNRGRQNDMGRCPRGADIALVHSSSQGQEESVFVWIERTRTSREKGERAEKRRERGEREKERKRKKDLHPSTLLPPDLEKGAKGEREKARKRPAPINTFFCSAPTSNPSVHQPPTSYALYDVRPIRTPWAEFGHIWGGAPARRASRKF